MHASMTAACHMMLCQLEAGARGPAALLPEVLHVVLHAEGHHLHRHKAMRNRSLRTKQLKMVGAAECRKIHVQVSVAVQDLTVHIAFDPEVNQPALAGLAVFPATPGCFPDALPLPQLAAYSLRGACPPPQSTAGPSPGPAAGPSAGPAPAAALWLDALDATTPAAGPTAASPLPAIAAPAGAPAQAMIPSLSPAAAVSMAAPEQATSPSQYTPAAAPAAVLGQAPSPSQDPLVAAPAAAPQSAGPSPAPVCSAQPVYAASCGPSGATFTAPDSTVFQSVDAAAYLAMYDNSFSSSNTILDQGGAVSEYTALFQTQCQARMQPKLTLRLQSPGAPA